MTSSWFNPQLVEDPADPRLDDVRDLNSSDSRPDLPGGKGLVIAEGTLVVPRLLASRYPVRSIVGFRSKLEALAEQLQSEGFFTSDAHRPPEYQPPQVFEVSREVLREVAGFDMHRGLVAAANRVAERGVEEVLDLVEATNDGAKVVAVLEGVGDHENIGAMFRNAAGLGVDAVLFGAATADPLYRRSVRVSMGHVLRTPFARLEGKTTTWQRSLEQLRRRVYTVIALTPNTEETLMSAVALAQRRAEAEQRESRIAIMVGAEGPGLTEHAMRAADIRAAIPMASGTDSLNVATAAAIGFYAARH